MIKKAQPAFPRPIAELKRLSLKLRKKVLTTIYQAGSGHPAGSLSSLEIIISLYFSGVLKHDPRYPHWPSRDRFVLSAGHLCPSLYAVLAEAGYFNKALLGRLRQFNSPLQGHPEKGSLPGIETTSGSLGQGLSLAAGMALAAKQANTSRPLYHVFALLSDGEQQEGQVWEAVMLASKYQLGNLVAVIDRNQIQIDGRTEEIMPLEPLINKYRSFGWRIFQTNGHQFRPLITALHQAKAEKKRPAVVIADTVAGKGVSFMEGKTEWHGKKLSEEDYKKAIALIKG